MKIHVKVFISIFYMPTLFLAYSNIAHALAIAPFTPPFSDTFDFYDTGGAAWKTLDDSTKRFDFEGADASTCLSEGCIAGNSSDTNRPFNYKNFYIASSTGALTVEAKVTDNGSHEVKGSISICAQNSNCADGLRFDFTNTTITDGTWHKYFVAWRPGGTRVEVCILVDDTNSFDCSWKETIFDSGTKVGGVALWSQSTYQSAPNNNLWFDELQDAWSLLATCTLNCNSNVIFLPGIEGSRLYQTTPAGEKRLWEPNNNTDSLQLALNPDGTSINSLYTKQGEVLDEVCISGICPNIYKTFIAHMNDLKTQKVISDWEAVSYDWRLSLDQIVNSGTQDGSNISYQSATSSPYIIQELKRLAASSKTGKVTIVAHSNGGLVTKALIAKLGPLAATYIDKVILVASPQLGTPDTIASILHGRGLDIPLSIDEATARSVAQNMPGAYNLLPSTQYFTYTDDPVVTFDQKTLPDWFGKYGSTIHSTDRLRAFMTDTTRSAPSFYDLENPTIANALLFSSSTSMHAALDSWTPPTGIQLFTIAGWGNTTLAGMEYKKVVTNTCTQTQTLGKCIKYQTGTKLTFTPKQVIDGDGTVIQTSALWANGATTTRYWVDLQTYNSDNKIKTAFGFFSLIHRNILEVPSLRTLIDTIVTSSSTSLLPQYISSTQPTSTKGARLNFVLHSPLTLGFTDSSGNYTGATATSTLFNIPDVEYKQYGDVQWLSVPKEMAGKLVMHGTDTGSFTLDIQETNNTATVATTSFEGIPSSTSTLATMDISPILSPTSNGTLIVDYNGDGVIDITLTAQPGSTVTPDLVAPEAILSADIFARDLQTVGLDETSSTTVLKAATSTTITDASGNKTVLSFQKTYSNKLLTYARLTGIQYGAAAPINLPTSFAYLWDLKQTLISQTVVVDTQFIIQATYDKSKNKTTIITLKKNVPIQIQTIVGLAVIKLTTDKGIVRYGW